MSDTPKSSSPIPSKDSGPIENELRMARQRERKTTKPNPLEPPELRSKPAPTSTVSSRHVPHEVRHRFVQVGRIYYFQDGAKAFEDHGRRLTTPSENTEVVASLVAIAQVRGWKRVIVSGSERFRQEAWRQASIAGLTVRGYKPSAVEQAKLAQDLGRSRAESPEPAARKRRPLPKRDEAPEIPLAPPSTEAPAPTRKAEDRAAIFGTLLEKGSARYRHEPEGTPSYFVRLATPAGERIVWGRDLERALSVSRSNPQVGDAVRVRREGREPVSIRFADRRADGTVVNREEVKFRNRWSIETAAWLAERAALAEALKHPDKSPDATSPELINARLALRQAELMAEQHIAGERQRAGFASAVRAELAQRLARGEDVPTPTLRAPTPELAPRERGAPGL